MRKALGSNPSVSSGCNPSSLARGRSLKINKRVWCSGISGRSWVRMCRSLSCLHLTRGANPRILKTSTQMLKIEMLSARTELMKHTADVLLGRRNPQPLGVVASHPLPMRKALGATPGGVLRATCLLKCRQMRVVCIALKGTWCSGITSASHAEGPGFKSQWVHSYGHCCGRLGRDQAIPVLTLL